MNLPISFIQTRSRKTNPETSREAGKEAASDRSAVIRMKLSHVIQNAEHGGGIGWTAKELASIWGFDLPTAYRRLPECSGIKRDPVLRRDGCSVWIKA